ncbi:beta-hydroxyacyl-(acyl-carrier-protein) dehydratase FabA/FabZ [Solidesulfovibrio carbinoliphilus subsp. oakridgensis]|uniref:Beta-hydroxyacyl-(Acyl-carrier-protein) dehydratase FabA/FabZ n=1 Tax=Solidesulfovibrio carbinoliphilus subsp. oakridgensis TaxID=694327 RepID=G7QBH8_9BACT|nr:beta-hydroxyacyl-(acyl-carrier-protein) dehydratase FabA/FabZ [Solidesulfovibrio carbinoliphilus]EHJ48841.1 beta-hydroxyacyl-(acyl-carrier-protein) dehydratase FabA/FabZ [Solidesulfovibrio carbinoliphilus subsp. oakridgensis]
MSELFQAVVAAGQGDVRADEDGWYGREFVFGNDFPGFAGHFPGSPVLPAMVQMLAGASLASRWLDRIPEVRSVSNAKFLAPIAPDVAVTVQARAQGPDAAVVRVLLGDRLAATFTLGFSTSL